MTWLFLIIAILFEVAGTTFMKLSNGFTKPVPSLLVLFFYGVSFFVMSLALKKLEMSVAYAIWSGLGTALVALIGIVYFRENANLMKVVAIALIIAGVMGLNISGTRN